MASSKLSFHDKVLRHTQAMARHFLAYPADTLEDISGLICASMKATKPEDVAEVVRYLRKPSTQMLLGNHWEVSLFSTSSGGWRLVSLSLTDQPEAARRRVSYRPAGDDQCWFCLIAEKGFGELVPIFDLYGAAIPAVRVHRGGCARAYHRLRALAEKPDPLTEPEPKENLL